MFCGGGGRDEFVSRSLTVFPIVELSFRSGKSKSLSLIVFYELAWSFQKVIARVGLGSGSFFVFGWGS